MAFVAPIAAAIGTGVTAASPFIAAGASLLQFSEQRSAARIQEREGKIAAQQEEVAAIQRESDRKGRLATALASQSAAAGAKGVLPFEGSPLTILSEDIRREEVATQRDVFQSGLASLTARSRGKVRASATRRRAAVGLLSDVGQIAETT